MVILGQQIDIFALGKAIFNSTIKLMVLIDSLFVFKLAEKHLHHILVKTNEAGTKYETDL